MRSNGLGFSSRVEAYQRLHRRYLQLSWLTPGTKGSDISFSPFSLALSPAPGRCFRTWVLITCQFFCFFFYPVFRLTSVPPPSIFRKLAGMTLPSTLALTVLLQRNTRLFPFLCRRSHYLSGTECGQIFHSF